MPPPLTPQRLRRVCDPATLSFDTTESLPPLEEVIGQDRAVSAIAFGIEIDSRGYHIYAAGPAGTGRTSILRKFLERRARSMPAPPDWCYVYNFLEPAKPKALSLPAGRGVELRSDMERFVEDLRSSLPRAFEGEQYEKQQMMNQRRYNEMRESALDALRKESQEKGFTVVETPAGILMAPVIDGQPIGPEEFLALDEEKRRAIQEREKSLHGTVRDTLRRIRQLEKEARVQAREIDREIVSGAVGHLLEELQHKYADLTAVLEYLEAVRGDLRQEAPLLKPGEIHLSAAAQDGGPTGFQRRSIFDRYRINVVVDNSGSPHAPVVHETNPTYHNLSGRVEYEASFGSMFTDFSMIMGGSLQRANGGFLIVDAQDILTKPFAWDVLERSLKRREIRIEPLGREFQVNISHSLEPDPIPLDLKVIVIGDLRWYQLLHLLDEDFPDLFKVKADFGPHMTWDDDATRQYARFVATLCREEGLRHFDRGGVAKILEHGARVAGDQGRLATRFGRIADVVRQASHWAGKRGDGPTGSADVVRALQQRVYRSNLVEELIRELIAEGTLRIETRGAVVGQVNGISVLSVGDHAFGRPTRITASFHVGTAGIIAIERDVKLAGPIHNKGAMILAGYLGSKYARAHPLALTATLTFEQTYEEVEGDSASSAELYAMLSALSGLPLRQDLAVTGSIDQHGRIQAIGGVNEKIEGFFDVCRLLGLTGTQGVIIPESNARNLMLREDVVAAVGDGQFAVHAVTTAEEAIELLTGKPAGQPDADGRYPEGTINAAAQRTLDDLASRIRPYITHESGTRTQPGRG